MISTSSTQDAAASRPCLTYFASFILISRLQKLCRLETTNWIRYSFQQGTLPTSTQEAGQQLIYPVCSNVASWEIHELNPGLKWEHRLCGIVHLPCLRLSGQYNRNASWLHPSSQDGIGDKLNTLGFAMVDQPMMNIKKHQQNRSSSPHGLTTVECSLVLFHQQKRHAAPGFWLLAQMIKEDHKGGDVLLFRSSQKMESSKIQDRHIQKNT